MKRFIHSSVALCALAVTVRGQTGNPPDDKTPTIVISATRVATPIDQTPASVTVITGKQLEEQQIFRVADALREVPGLSVVQTGTPGQVTSVFTRGLKSEHTQVLIDGIPLN